MAVLTVFLIVVCCMRLYMFPVNQTVWEGKGRVSKKGDGKIYEIL